MLELLKQRVMPPTKRSGRTVSYQKDQFGVEAWGELQSKWLTRMFDVIVAGEKKTLSYGEANGPLQHPDRATRESANRAIYGLLGKDGEIFPSASLRNICNDWVTVSKRRKYSSPMESSLLNNDTEQTIIDNLLNAIEKAQAIIAATSN